MWVFGYGSLMWDGWERELKGIRIPGARLDGFHRSFNKASSTNWGTRDHRGPTLGLEPDPNGVVIGVAFEFWDDQRAQILSRLAPREGPSFSFEVLPISFIDAPSVRALVPVNNRKVRTYIGHLQIAERAAMARLARGTSGACADYVRDVRDHLRALTIEDKYVEDFADEMHRFDAARDN